MHRLAEECQEQIGLLCRSHRIRELSLFGSVLRDDFSDRRDIDLLVEFDESAPIGFMALGAMEQDFARLFGRPVDVVVKRSLRPALRDGMISSAHVIYAAP
jgi:uncharacterized protein